MLIRGGEMKYQLFSFCPLQFFEYVTVCLVRSLYSAWPTKKIEGPVVRKGIRFESDCKRYTTSDTVPNKDIIGFSVHEWKIEGIYAFNTS